MKSKVSKSFVTTSNRNQYTGRFSHTTHVCEVIGSDPVGNSDLLFLSRPRHTIIASFSVDSIFLYKFSK